MLGKAMMILTKIINSFIISDSEKAVLDLYQATQNRIGKLSNNPNAAGALQYQKDLLAKLSQFVGEKVTPSSGRGMGGESVSFIKKSLTPEFLQSVGLGGAAAGFEGLLSGSAESVRNGASQLERFSVKLADAFGSLNLNKEELANFQQLLRERLKPALSQANEIPPAPPLSMAGSLVRYFSPEAFRDTVQEREVANAQIETAKNTAEMVRLLSDVSIKGTTLTPLSMGAAGVLGGMMPAVVSKP
jgi:hypothetical protein